MREISVEKGDWVFFHDNQGPMKVLAHNDRFMICNRELSLDYDHGLLQHEVDMRAFFNIDEAFQYYKEDPVYTIIDFEDRCRGPHNLIFNSYDFSDPESMNELLINLSTGETEISRRRKIPLVIDIAKTESINKRQTEINVPHHNNHK